MKSTKVTTTKHEEHDAKGNLLKTTTGTTTEEYFDGNVSGKKTYAIFVLDSSGSMMDGWDSTIKQYNANLDLLGNKQDELGEVNVSMIKFADNTHFFFKNQTPQQAQRLDRGNYYPNGSTALNDALGAAIQYAKDTFKDLDQPDVAVLINVFTLPPGSKT